MKICITGGAGYVGSRLVPQLLADGHKVIVYDTFWFGDGYLPSSNCHLKLIKADIRDANQFAAAAYGCEAVIHLAGLTSDACCQKNERLSSAVNHDAFDELIKAAIAAGVQRFIFCSSAAVYGSTAETAIESHVLAPSTLYSASKALCEATLAHYRDRLCCITLRPATISGYAPHMRFDTTIHRMMRDAVMKGVITVNGGAQIRSHLHIRDMIKCYRLMLSASKEKICGQTYNVHAENISVGDLALVIKETVEHEFGKTVAIKQQDYADNRSYQVDSEKIYQMLGFRYNLSVHDICKELAIRFHGGYWKDALTNPIYMNIYEQERRG